MQILTRIFAKLKLLRQTEKGQINPWPGAMNTYIENGNLSENKEQQQERIAATKIEK